MDASDRLVRETFIVELGAYQPVALFKGHIQFLHVCRSQLVQLGAAQSRDDMLIDSPLIGHLGVGSEVWLLVPLIPEVQPVRQQDSGFRLVRHKLFRRFPELCQLCRAFRLGFGEDISSIKLCKNKKDMICRSLSRTTSEHIILKETANHVKKYTDR